jgi:hypothetical protein
MTMNTARFAGRGGVMAMIAPHATGHAFAKDRTLLRVDFECGIGWVATHYDLNLRVIQEVRGSGSAPRSGVLGTGLGEAMGLHVIRQSC